MEIVELWLESAAFLASTFLRPPRIPAPTSYHDAVTSGAITTSGAQKSFLLSDLENWPSLNCRGVEKSSRMIMSPFDEAISQNAASRQAARI